MKINAKRVFCLVASISLIGAASIFGILELQKSKKQESEKKKLDEFYLEKLCTSHSTILSERKDSLDELFLEWAFKDLEETKERMSKDGYNWRQIEGMDKEAEWKVKEKLWSQDEGYEDGIAGRPKNPEKDLWGTAPFGVRAAYLHGYKEGEKARLFK